MNNKKENHGISLVILSIMSLLNVIFLPVFDVWGGLFPSEYDNCFEVLRKIITDFDEYGDDRVVLMTLTLLIPSVFMLVFSLLQKRGWFIASTLSGIGFWIYFMAEYAYHTESEFFDFSDECSYSIGTWVGIVIFILAFFCALSAKKNTVEKNPISVTNAANINTEIKSKNNMDHKNNSIRFCPKCGAKATKGSFFCGDCGYQFKNIEK